MKYTITLDEPVGSLVSGALSVGVTGVTATVEESDGPDDPGEPCPAGEAHAANRTQTSDPETTCMIRPERPAGLLW
ncbi:MAG: hypothetical protein GX454_02510 [Brooklawnia sp.]|nr:hypothetical protein [Brooklawnia sp.]